MNEQRYSAYEIYHANLRLNSQLQAVPLLVYDGKGCHWNPEREQIIERHAEEFGISLDVPKGARNVGCRNCRAGERLHDPNLPQRTYCFGCPAQKRR